MLKIGVCNEVFFVLAIYYYVLKRDTLFLLKLQAFKNRSYFWGHNLSDVLKITAPDDIVIYSKILLGGDNKVVL